MNFGKSAALAALRYLSPHRAAGEQLKTLFSAFWGVALLATASAHASTPVTGNVSGVWTEANSPYLVNGNVVAANLTIQPGVQVFFTGDYSFTVAGRLTAVGRNNARITFSPRTDGGSWKGISFEFAGNDSELGFCQISGANQGGVRIRSSQPKIHDCQIIGNKTTVEPALGGGIWTDSPLTLTRCDISGNRAASTVTAAGGGVYSTAALTMEACTVLNNSIGVGVDTTDPVGAGGGVYCSGDLTLNGCIIGGNSVNSASPRGLGLAAGGGVYADAGLYATNCGIGYNTAFGQKNSVGGGVFMASGSLVNCTIIQNKVTGPAPQGGGVFCANAGTALNCIVWDNAPTQLAGVPTVSYSDVMDGAAGTGNINRDPLLVANSFYVRDGSPAIDAGSPAAIFNDRCFSEGLSHGGARNDMGAGGGPLACAFRAGDAPAIATQPQSQSSCLGKSVTFTVSATGDGLRYQWLLNQAALPGQTAANLTLSSVQAGMAGSYTVRVENDFGSVISNPAQLVLSDSCIEIAMVAGLTVSGVPGATYQISFTTNPGDNAVWTPIATTTLTTSEWFFADRDSANAPKRFYRAIKLQ
jgi:hypothetical protein